MGKNSFEQICINYLNEKLRQFATKCLIKDELDWYEAEGLNAPKIGFLDNELVLGTLFLM